MKLQSSHIAIGRLRVRTPPAGRQAAVAEIERAGWPQAGHDEWLFIRQVKVRAPRPWLGLRAATSARELAAAAVAGGAVGADQAVAVRFCSLPELLAWLSADLAAGRAASRWYWRRWRHLFGFAPGDAVAHLWEEHIAYLPAVTAQLASIGHLRSVWPVLTADNARQLGQALAVHTGLPVFQTAQSEQAPESPPALQLPGIFLLRWEATVHRLPMSDARRRLAAALVAVEWRPLLLQSAPETTLLAVSRGLVSLSGPSFTAPDATGQKVGGSAEDSGSATAAVVAAAAEFSGRSAAVQPGSATGELAVRDRGDSAPSGVETAERTFPPVPETVDPGVAVEPPDNDGEKAAAVRRPDRPAVASDTKPWQGRSATRAAAGIGSQAGSAPRHSDFSPPTPPAGAAELRRERPVTPIAEVPERPEFPPAEDRVAQAPTSGIAEVTGLPEAEVELTTGQGGLFYLINALDRPEIRQVIEAHGGWQQLSDGWAWLYRLGLELGLEPTGELALFLAQRMGFDHVDDLQELPPLPARGPLLERLESIYRTAQLWDVSLLQVPAWLRCSASHLDLYYPLSSVRLEVRLAGLDIDPGWVPWLGRVVTFYYWEQPGELSRGES